MPGQRPHEDVVVAASVYIDALAARSSSEGGQGPSNWELERRLQCVLEEVDYLKRRLEGVEQENIVLREENRELLDTAAEQRDELSHMLEAHDTMAKDYASQLNVLGAGYQQMGRTIQNLTAQLHSRARETERSYEAQLAAMCAQAAETQARCEKLLAVTVSLNTMHRVMESLVKGPATAPSPLVDTPCTAQDLYRLWAGTCEESAEERRAHLISGLRGRAQHCTTESLTLCPFKNSMDPQVAVDGTQECVMFRTPRLAEFISAVLSQAPNLRHLTVRGCREWPVDGSLIRSIKDPFPALETLGIERVQWRAVDVEELLRFLDVRDSARLQQLALTWEMNPKSDEMEVVESISAGRVKWVSGTALNTAEELYDFWMKKLGGAAGWPERITESGLTDVLERCPIEEIRVQTGTRYSDCLSVPYDQLVAFTSVVLSRLPGLRDMSRFFVYKWPFDWALASGVARPFPALARIDCYEAYWTLEGVRELFHRLDEGGSRHLEKLYLRRYIGCANRETLEKEFGKRVVFLRP